MSDFFRRTGLVVVSLLDLVARAHGGDSNVDALLSDVMFERDEVLRSLLAEGDAIDVRLIEVIRAQADRELARKAIFVLGERRERARSHLALLTELLRHEETRYLAATALAKVAPNPPVYLADLLLAVRRAQPCSAQSDAHCVLSQLLREMTRPLYELLDHDNADVRMEAFRSLRYGGAVDRELLLSLVRRGIQGAPRVRGPSAILCVHLDAELEGLRAPLLEAVLSDRPGAWEYGARAIEALDRIGAADEQTGRALLEALAQGHSHVKERAARLLGKLRIAPNETLAGLREAVAHDNDDSVRREAAYALARFPEDAEESLPVLVAALHEVRCWISNRGAMWTSQGNYWAADALGHFRERAAPAVPDLLLALRYGARGVWSSAVVALGNIGPGAAAAVPALLESIEYGPGGGAQAVIGRGELARLREYEENCVRDKAIVALGRIGSAAKSALPSLEKLAMAGNMGAEDAIRRIRGTRDR